MVEMVEGVEKITLNRLNLLNPTTAR